MKRPSQLTRLIWDFYRENQRELRLLKLLRKCKVFRRWGVLHINCSDREVADALVEAHSLIVEPVNQLKLAQRLKISVDKNLIACFELNSGQLFSN